MRLTSCCRSLNTFSNINLRFSTPVWKKGFSTRMDWIDSNGKWHFIPQKLVIELRQIDEVVEFVLLCKSRELPTTRERRWEKSYRERKKESDLIMGITVPKEGKAILVALLIILTCNTPVFGFICRCGALWSAQYRPNTEDRNTLFK